MANCFCDDQCQSFGDCCADKADVCEAPEQACGGLLGLACDAGEYCHFEPDQMSGAADQTGVCLTTPEACIEIFMPVCGCDDQTYGNACVAHAAGVSVASEGECPSSNVCGTRGAPECPSESFCDFPAGSHCGAADEGGTCRPFSEFCPENSRRCAAATARPTATAASRTPPACRSITTARAETEGQFCGGFGGIQCPDGFVCVDDPDDGCDPANGGADCGGVCE